MTQNPVYCGRCHTTRPPLFSIRTYTCVMCGKSRTVDEYKDEMAKLRSAAPQGDTGVYPSAAWRPDAGTAARVAAATARQNPPKVRRPKPAPPTPAKPKARAKAAPKPVPVAKAPAAKVAPAPKPVAKPAPVPKPAAKAVKAAAAPKAAAAAPKVVGVGTGCAWKDCGNTARPRSKYCSRACSNKNARYRHSQRK
ncbi:MAG: hypothetical protein KDA24_07090 [Deltaproteobacteria bacterium]|nr:hypothetical protein [Deltaproteobacteria bacterium]